MAAKNAQVAMVAITGPPGSRPKITFMHLTRLSDVFPREAMVPATIKKGTAKSVVESRPVNSCCEMTSKLVGVYISTPPAAHIITTA